MKCDLSKAHTLSNSTFISSQIQIHLSIYFASRSSGPFVLFFIGEITAKIPLAG